MLAILTFWYKESPNRFYTTCINSISSLEDRFAVRDTIKNLNKPIFQDYTLQGRFIGILLRLSRIAAALILYFITFIIFGFGFVVWLLFPLLCVLSVIGSLFGA